MMARYRVRATRYGVGKGAGDGLAGRTRSPAPDLRRGLTILEVLVALLLFSFILAGLFALTRSTLRFTGTSVAAASSITNVSKAEAYVADLFRVAKAVFGTLDVEVAPGNVLQCRLEGDADPDDPIPAGRCIELLIPVVDDDGTVQRIIDYDLSVISVEEIGSRFEGAGVERGFDGETTLAMFEYRAFGLCGTGGPSPAPQCTPGVGVLNLESGATVPVVDAEGLLLVGISPVNAAGTASPTFRLAGDDVASRTLLMRFIVRSHGPTGSPFTVRESAVALEVAVRGLAPVQAQ